MPVEHVLHRDLEYFIADDILEVLFPSVTWDGAGNNKAYGHGLQSAPFVWSHPHMVGTQKGFHDL